MLSQTISQIQPLLEVIHQPAFTVSDGGVIAANTAAPCAGTSGCAAGLAASAPPSDTVKAG